MGGAPRAGTRYDAGPRRNERSPRHDDRTGGGPMPKRLIVCCDGTWNNPDSETHVSWIYEACRGRDGGDGLRQEAFYINGVGTAPGERLAGGSVGAGLSHNVRDAYRWVRDHHEPGDELFVFGF